MRFRRRKPDPERARRAVEQARRAAQAAARTKEAVEASNSEIMAEVETHKRLLAINNFAAKLHAALGGEGT